MSSSDFVKAVLNEKSDFVKVPSDYAHYTLGGKTYTINELDKINNELLGEIKKAEGYLGVKFASFDLASKKYNPIETIKENRKIFDKAKSDIYNLFGDRGEKFKRQLLEMGIDDLIYTHTKFLQLSKDEIDTNVERLMNLTLDDKKFTDINMSLSEPELRKKYDNLSYGKMLPSVSSFSKPQLIKMVSRLELELEQKIKSLREQYIINAKNTKEIDLNPDFNDIPIEILETAAEWSKRYYARLPPYPTFKEEKYIDKNFGVIISDGNERILFKDDYGNIRIIGEEIVTPELMKTAYPIRLLECMVKLFKTDLDLEKFGYSSFSEKDKRSFLYVLNYKLAWLESNKDYVNRVLLACQLAMTSNDPLLMNNDAIRAFARGHNASDIKDKIKLTEKNKLAKILFDIYNNGGMSLESDDLVTKILVLTYENICKRILKSSKEYLDVINSLMTIYDKIGRKYDKIQLLGYEKEELIAKVNELTTIMENKNLNKEAVDQEKIDLATELANLKKRVYPGTAHAMGASYIAQIAKNDVDKIKEHIEIEKKNLIERENACKQWVDFADIHSPGHHSSFEEMMKLGHSTAQIKDMARHLRDFCYKENKPKLLEYDVKEITSIDELYKKGWKEEDFVKLGLDVKGIMEMAAKPKYVEATERFIETQVKAIQAEIESGKLKKEEVELLSKYGIHPDAVAKWKKIYGDKSEIVESSEEVKIQPKKEKTMLDMLQQDAKNAAYRVAATQLSQVIKNGIVAMCKNDVDEGMVKALSQLLDSPLGEAFIAMLLGYGLVYAPMIKDDPRVSKLSEEFRIGGMTTAGNEIIGQVTKFILPEALKIIQGLPDLENKVRVMEEQHEEVDVAKTTTSAKA
jgi:hypothetical protein